MTVILFAGFITAPAVQGGQIPSSVGQLQRVLCGFLKELNLGASIITLPIQIAAMDSLLEMYPVKKPSSKQVVDVIKGWLRTQLPHTWGRSLNDEFERCFCNNNARMIIKPS